MEWDQLGDQYINKFLVEFLDAKVAFEETIEKTENIPGDLDWVFILGDYGSGKTQLKNQVMEETEKGKHQGYVLSVPVAFQRDSFSRFAKRFVSYTKNLFVRYHGDLIAEFDAEFSKFQEELSDSDKTTLILDIIEKCGQKIKFVLNFDELDQVRDEEDFKIWADFICSLNDHIDKGLLGIFYLTQREISKYWEKDDRLHRLNFYFYNPYELGYADHQQIPDVFANIIALFELSNNMQFEGKTIELLHAYLVHTIDFLKTMKIRELNIRILSLCDALDKMEQQNIWETVKHIKKLDMVQRGLKAEAAIKKLLEQISIDFTSFDVDYTAKYTKQIMDIGEHRSDGKIVLYRKVGELFEPEIEVPVEIKFASGERHEAPQLKKVTKMAQAYPTIFFSIVSGERGLDGMYQRFSDELAEKKLLMINIDSSLFDPVLAVADSDDRLLIRMAGAWLRQISNINEKIRQFLESQTKEMIISRLERQVQELMAGIPADTPTPVTIPPPTPPPTSSTTETEPPVTPPAPTPTPSLSTSLLQVGNTVIVAFDDVSRKKKSSLSDHIVTILKKIGTTDITAKIPFVSKVVNHLIAQGFLNETAAFYTKTEAWDKEKALASLKILS